MNELTFTPTQSPSIPRRGRTAQQAWLDFRAMLDNPNLKNGGWYVLNLAGLSFTYARKLAIKAGYKTSESEGELKVMFPHPLTELTHHL